MEEKNEGYGLQQFNATDLMKRYTVQQVFRTLDDACIKQENINENSFETSFTKRVDLVEGLLWKYTPPEIRETIKDLRSKMDNEIKGIDTSLSEKNKLLNQKKIAYEYSIEIFKFLEVVLTNSPITVEYAEMEVFGDFKELINTIRTPNPVKLFNTELG